MKIIKRAPKGLILAAAALLALCLAACGGENPGPVEPGNGDKPREPVEVNILDYEEYKVMTDWANAFKNAFKDADIIYVPAGTYNITSISVPSGKTIYGDGDETVLVATEKNPIKVDGIAYPTTPIASDVPDFSDRVEVRYLGRIAEGDLIYILSQRSFLVLEDAGEQWCLGGNYEGDTHGYFGEFATVKSIEGSTLTLEENLRFPYYLSHNREESDKMPDGSARPTRESTTVQKIIPVEDVTLRDFTIVNNIEGYAVSLNYAKNCVVENVKHITPEGVRVAEKANAFAVFYSIGCEIRNCSSVYGSELVIDFNNLPFNSTWLPFRMASSIDSGFVGCDTNASFSGYLINYAYKGGPSTGCYIIDCEAQKAPWGGISVGQGTLDTLVENCRVTNSSTGIRLAGRDTVCRNNYIELNAPMNLNYRYVRPDTGGAVGIMLTEGYAIDVIVENNIIKNSYTGICVRDGYELSNIYTYGSVILRNNTIEGCKQGLYTWKVTSNRGADTLDILFEGNTIKETAYVNMDYGLRLCPRTVGVSIKNNVIEGAGTALCLEAFSDKVEFSGNEIKDGTFAVQISAVSEAEKKISYNVGLKTEIIISGNRLTGVLKEVSGDSQSHVTVKK